MARERHPRRLGIVVLASGAAALALGSLTVHYVDTVVGVAVVIVTLAAGARRVFTRRTDSWSVGAAGERRTARLLAPLTWTGRYVVLHDRAVPSSRANLDHILLSRRGAQYLDTKNWLSAQSVRVTPDGQLWNGRFPQGRAVETVRWEAQRVQQAIGWPVRPVIVIHGATVPGGIIQLGDVAVVQASMLRRYLRSLPTVPGWNRNLVKETGRIADAKLPPATGRRAKRARRARHVVDRAQGFSRLLRLGRGRRGRGRKNGFRRSRTMRRR
ncbi:nuclease-related domain-containing protein [Streptomyces microflavus]|uniref:nuclease-related domain-containing protein n=1 Tax=Streptomyces microflavus TaxID=1919 RepID=UPI0037F6B635